MDTFDSSREVWIGQGYQGELESQNEKIMGGYEHEGTTFQHPLQASNIIKTYQNTQNEQVKQKGVVELRHQ